jgi:prepilin-type N-terminal cleavage/methylation domain-containing protein
MRIARHTQGFTVIELLVGMLITSILLSAIATLAFAMSVAARDADDTIRAQMQLRYATLRISELIRTSRLVCVGPGNDLVLWTTDHYDVNRIDVNEIVYIEYDDSKHELKLLEFDLKASPTVLADLGLPETDPILTRLAQTQTKTTLLQKYQGVKDVVRDPNILSGCCNVKFSWDVGPPRTRRLTISFDLAENNGVHHYEIDTTLLASAQNLLNGAPLALVSDDD